MNRYDHNRHNSSRQQKPRQEGLIELFRRTLSGRHMSNNNAGKKAQSAFVHGRGNLPPLHGQPYQGAKYDSRQGYSQRPAQTSNHSQHQSQLQGSASPQARYYAQQLTNIRSRILIIRHAHNKRLGVHSKGNSMQINSKAIISPIPDRLITNNEPIIRTQLGAVASL